MHSPKLKGINKIADFEKKINELTIVQKGEAEIRDYIKISQCPAIRVSVGRSPC
jgi:hypothetical protein